MPPPCFQRPWRSISRVGAPFWAIRRAMPTRPLWPLKNSQSEGPAALAITFTRREICDFDSPNTFLPTTNTHRPDDVQGAHGGGGNGHHGILGLNVGLGMNHSDAAVTVVPAHNNVTGDNGDLAAPQQPVRNVGAWGNEPAAQQIRRTNTWD